MTFTVPIAARRPFRVFLSHAKADDVHARKVRAILSLQPNLRLFTEDSLSPGEDWAARLKRELSECDLFLILVSPNSSASQRVPQELGAAWGMNKPIIPILTDPRLSANMPVALSGTRPLSIAEFERPETLHQILEQHGASALIAGDGGP